MRYFNALLGFMSVAQLCACTLWISVRSQRKVDGERKEYSGTFRYSMQSRKRQRTAEKKEEGKFVIATLTLLFSFLCPFLTFFLKISEESIFCSPSNLMKASAIKIHWLYFDGHFLCVCVRKLLMIITKTLVAERALALCKKNRSTFALGKKPHVLGRRS